MAIISLFRVLLLTSDSGGFLLSYLGTACLPTPFLGFPLFRFIVCSMRVMHRWECSRIISLCVFDKGDVVCVWKYVKSTLTHKARNIITTTCPEACMLSICTVHSQQSVGLHCFTSIAELECDKQSCVMQSRL